ncbi:MAG: DNA polymerase Y family protein [Candidatus Acidiferrales bacterium]
MAFAAIHVPDFMLQAVVRAEPHLYGRALVLIDGTPPLEIVVAASESAARAGIGPGMAKSQVEQFRGVEIRHRSCAQVRAQEKSAHAALLDLGWSFSPRLEDVAPDTIVLDLAGLQVLCGSEENIADQLVQRAGGLGLAVNVAIASRIESSIIAARSFSAITLIPAGQESESLGHLPVRALSPSAELLEILERWGVRTCAALAALPVLDLSERLGQEGVRLHALARGEDARSLILAEPAAFFEEEMELDDAVEELEPLSFILGRLLDQLCARLNARSLAVQTIRLRFDLERSPEKNIRTLNEDSRQKSTASTYENNLTLPVPIRDSKTLLRLLRLKLQADPPPAPILKVVIGADPAASRTTQGGLFLAGFPDPEKWELMLARLANLVGEANVGSPELMDTHLQGEFRMDRFEIILKEADAAQNRKNAPAKEDGRALRTKEPVTALHVFRPPVVAKVELREECPVHIVFCGVRAEVIAASGPWRTSGNWWGEGGWQHDEWDIEIRCEVAGNRPAVSDRPVSGDRPVVGNRLTYDGREQNSVERSGEAPRDGMYRIYYDGLRRSWFVRGVYD